MTMSDGGRFTITHKTTTVNGAEIAWDGEAQAGFICVEHATDPGCAWGSRQQIELRPGLIVDIDVDGRVRGIETIGWEAGFHDLLDVIRWQNDRLDPTEEAEA